MDPLTRCEEHGERPSLDRLNPVWPIPMPINRPGVEPLQGARNGMRLRGGLLGLLSLASCAALVGFAYKARHKG